MASILKDRREMQYVVLHRQLRLLHAGREAAHGNPVTQAAWERAIKRVEAELDAMEVDDDLHS